MKSMMLGMLVGVAALLSGCASQGYWGDRARDAADCVTFTVSAGPEVSADAKLTEVLHLAAGGGAHTEAGVIGGDVGTASVATLGLPFAPFLEDGILYGRYAFTEVGGDWTDDHVQDECYALHVLDVAPTNPERALIDRFDIELGAIALLGARVGFSPGQFVDLLAGLVGADPAQDDAPMHAEPAPDAEADDSE